MEKQTIISLTQDEIEQRLKGVLDSAFKDRMLTWNGGHQLLRRIMCSLKGDDPESLTFGELTSYIPAPECVIVAQTPAPGSVKTLIDAIREALEIREGEDCTCEDAGDRVCLLCRLVAPLAVALAPFKGAQADASVIPTKPVVIIPRQVERLEDMSSDGRLRLFLQQDGDVVVEVSGREEHGEREKATVEFCSGGGGGKSPRVVEALKLLMAAMQTDNDAGFRSRDYQRQYYFDLRPEDRD